MSGATISVLMAAYNAERTIAEAVSSLLRQTWRDLELIIVDDGSSDRTDEIASKSGDPRVRVIRNGRNMGLAASLKRAEQHVSGLYVARMDADDMCRPERLERQAAFLRTHPDVTAVGTSFQLIDEASIVRDERVRPGDDEWLQTELLKWNPFSAGSLMMRGDTFREIGGYDVRFPTAEDCDLLLRLAERGRIAILPDLLYQWRVRPDSMTHAGRVKQLQFADLARRLTWQRRIRGRDALGRLLCLSPKEESDRRLLAEHAFVWGREALRQRRYAAATTLMSRSIAMSPFNGRLRRAALRAPRALARSLWRPRNE